MTLGIKYGGSDSTDQLESGFIYFDVVSSYSRSIKGQVTKNPIAGTTFVTDNFTRDNPILTLSAVISVADLSQNLLILDEDGNNANNYIAQPSRVSITGDGTSTLINALPTSISQLLGQSNVVITMDEARTNYRDFVESVLEQQMSGRKLNTKTQRYETKIRVVKLYEFTGNELSKIRDNLVLTGFTVKEDPNSGDALLCDLSFEEVTFVQLGKTELPKDVAASIKGKSSTSSKKGNVSSTGQDVTPPVEEQSDGTDPERIARATGGAQ